MQCAHVTELRHKVRVLVDFKAKKLLTAHVYRTLWKYNGSYYRISLGKLNVNKI